MIDGIDITDRCLDPSDEDAWGWCYRRASGLAQSQLTPDERRDSQLLTVGPPDQDVVLTGR